MIPSSKAFGVWPWCARCKKPVDSLMVMPDFGSEATRYTVACHGARETVSVESFVVMVSEPNSMQFGWAFDTQALENAA